MRASVSVTKVVTHSRLERAGGQLEYVASMGVLGAGPLWCRSTDGWLIDGLVYRQRSRKLRGSRQAVAAH